MFIINNYKTTENKYETQGSVTSITMLNKKGAEMVAKIDTEDLEKVQSMGIWFAEWNKNFNSYLAINLLVTKENKKIKSTKRNLQSVILNSAASAPINFDNNNTLDCRKSNLSLIDRNAKSEYETIDDETIAVVLMDNHGISKERALVSFKDMDRVINKRYTWIYQKGHKQPQVFANTPNGKVHMCDVILKPGTDERVHHINLNPLDNRRSNLEIKTK